MIDFLKYRGIVLIYSLVIFAGVVGLGFYRYQTRGSVFTYSVDFTGGTQILMKFEKPVSANELKNILEAKGWTGTITREFAPQEIMVRVKEFENDSLGLAERMKAAVIKAMPDSGATVLQSEAVGPGVGAELRGNSVRAVLFALIALLFYIALTFWSYSFAVGAVVALVHDAIVMLTFFMIFDRDISINVIAAILAVLGYSINDTIVIFSRIRGNLKKMRHIPLKDVVNTSLNQTLSRTILTSFATSLSVISMIIFGGEVLRDFSITLLIGIIFGTYSSIFIASPVMMVLHREEKAA